MASSDPVPDPLEDLVAECLRRRSVDGLLPVDEMCARHPLLAEALRAHEAEISCIHFDAGNRRLTTGAVDGSLRMWSLETGSRLLDLVGHKQGIVAIGSALTEARLVTCDQSEKCASGRQRSKT